MMTLSPIEVILGRLRDHGCNPRTSREGQWTAKCPNVARHNRGDKNPSLSVSIGMGDKALVHCHTGCTIADIAAALDLRVGDMFAPEEHDNRDRPRQVVARYPYCDADGELVYEVERMDPKGFRQRRPVGNGEWAYNLQGIDRRPLYKLPAVLAAVDEGRPVWLCEGEKDADALSPLVVPDPATTMSGGVSGWRPEHVEQLRGTAVLHIVADDDEPGRKHARDVAGQLVPYVGRIVIHLPHEGHKDAAEHIGAGRGLDELRTWWDSADSDEPDELDPPEDEQVHRLRSHLYIGDAIFGLPPVEWLVEGVVQRSGLTVTYGAPKSYKTFVVLDMWLHVANGLPWRGIATKQAKVLYIAAEGAPGVGPRAKAWASRYDGDLRNMAWITVAADLYTPGSDLLTLAEIIEEHGIDQVIVDTLARSMAGADENSGRDMGAVLGNIGWLMERTGCGVNLVHHTGKDTARGMRGHSSLQGAVDTSLEVIGDPHAVNCHVVDQKNAESGQSWWWKPRIVAPSLVLEPSEGVAGTDEAIDLTILRQLWELGGDSPMSRWEDAVVELGACGSTKFHKRVPQMESKGLVAKGAGKRGTWHLTPEGLQAMERGRL